MSAPLESLEVFLEEQLLQELPRSFMLRPALTLNDKGGTPASRFANWRRGLANRLANISQKRHENKQRIALTKHPELTAPLQIEVDALKSELEALRNEMRMMKGQFKAKKGSNGSSGDETVETAASDPCGFVLQALILDITDSDEEGGARSSDLTPSARLQRFTTQSGFGDDQFYGWSRDSQPSGFGLPTVVNDDADPEDVEQKRNVDLSPMHRTPSDATLSGFGDNQFSGW